jgi:hypothetical protein
VEKFEFANDWEGEDGVHEAEEASLDGSEHVVWELGKCELGCWVDWLLCVYVSRICKEWPVWCVLAYRNTLEVAG